MPFFQILIDRKLPQKFLTYKSDVSLNIGQIVEVPVRGKSCFGVTICEVTEIDFEEEKVKAITNIYPVTLSKEQLDFLFTFAYNTFNSLSHVADAILNNIKLITQKNIKLLNINSKTINKNNNLNENEKPLFYLDNKASLRIRYIIRTNILSILSLNNSNQNYNSNILILFPEKKLLEKTYKEFLLEINNILDEFKEQQINLNTYLYNGAPTKPSKESVVNILKNEVKTFNIFFTTRSGIFLPWKTLDKIIVVDEANTFYIQDQNSLYYDARDASFILSTTFKAQLIFVSRVPSIRLLQFYPKDILETWLNDNMQNDTKSLILQLLKREPKNTFFSLFSENILEKIGVEYKVD